MIRQAVVSSNLRSVGYDSVNNILEIEFLNGGIYQYFAVPENIYLGLINASSLGSYFHAHIKGVFQYVKVG